MGGAEGDSLQAKTPPPPPPQPHGGSRLSKVSAALVAKGRAHWIIALLVLLLSLVVTRYGAEFFHLRQARNVASQWLMQKTARGLKAHRVRLVLIHNDEFWKEPLAGRSPVNRQYLAQLVENARQG